jgi:hypothetical protein
MTVKTTARNLHLVRTAQVAGEAFGYQVLHESAGPAAWPRAALGFVLLGFLATAAYLAF